MQDIDTENGWWEMVCLSAQSSEGIRECLEQAMEGERSCGAEREQRWQKGKEAIMTNNEMKKKEWSRARLKYSLEGRRLS